jgi:hypothetical protein
MNDVLNDPIFGPLTWNPDSNWWEGHIQLYGLSDVEINIYVPDEDDRIISDLSRHAFGIVSQSETLMRQKACDDLLETHNESWNDDAPIDAATFMRRIVLESIVFYDDGSAEIYFADDDLFWGHVIIVSLSEDGEFTGAEIAG